MVNQNGILRLWMDTVTSWGEFWPDYETRGDHLVQQRQLWIKIQWTPFTRMHPDCIEPCLRCFRSFCPALCQVRNRYRSVPLLAPPPSTIYYQPGFQCYVSCHCWAFSLFNLLCFGLCDFNQKSALKQNSFVGFSYVLSLRFLKTEQNDQQLCSDWGCPSMHCNVCTVSSNGSAHPAKSGCPPPTTWPTFFWQPPQRSRPPWSYFSELDSVPPSLSRQSGETHMRLNKPTARCCATKKIRLASPNLWWVHCIGWRERVCTKLIEAGIPAAASSLLQLTKLASKPG